MRQGQISGYVFPGRARGEPLSDRALLARLKRMNPTWTDPVSRRPITSHGFRAAAQDLG